MKSGCTLLILGLACLQGYSQINRAFTQIPCEILQNRGDCHNAIEIKPINTIQFRCSPEGYGKQLEIQGNSAKSKYWLEQEHNSLWIKFEVSMTAILTFKIIPTDPSYDLDFLLFKQDGSHFCERLTEAENLPIRSNLARNKVQEKSRTGLSTLAKESFIRSGHGNNFSKALDVKKGDVYYLIVDNVHGGSSGFSLRFKYYRNKELKGKVIDKETGAGLAAQISWEDAITGELLKQTQSEATTGKYKINVPIAVRKKRAKYVLTAADDQHFFSEKTLDSTQLTTTYSSTIVIALPKLKEGGKIELHNIIYYGGSPKALPSSEPTFDRLKQMMIRHPSLKIQIEGHTNGCFRGVEVTQKLSEDRALTVKNYLIANAIAERRMAIKGFNCSRMLFPNPTNPWESSMNRRVEILIVKYRSQ